MTAPNITSRRKGSVEFTVGAFTFLALQPIARVWALHMTSPRSEHLGDYTSEGRALVAAVTYAAKEARL